MNKIVLHLSCLFLLGLAPLLATADTIVNVATNTIAMPNEVRPAAKVAMADLMYENGKIYVVVLVLLTIFAGIILFLINLEKKISKLEKQTH
jgi:hypothetical protein